MSDDNVVPFPGQEPELDAKTMLENILKDWQDFDYDDCVLIGVKGRSTRVHSNVSDAGPVVVWLLQAQTQIIRATQEGGE